MAGEKRGEMLDSEQARKFLSSITDQGKCFWLKSGQVLKNVEELLNAIENAPEDVFKHHVAADHNDFANWIKDVIGDKALANSINRIKTRKGTIEALRKRITYLKAIAK